MVMAAIQDVVPMAVMAAVIAATIIRRITSSVDLFFISVRFLLIV